MKLDQPLDSVLGKIHGRSSAGYVNIFDVNATNGFDPSAFEQVEPESPLTHFVQS